MRHDHDDLIERIRDHLARNKKERLESGGGPGAARLPTLKGSGGLTLERESPLPQGGDDGIADRAADQRRAFSRPMEQEIGRRPARMGADVDASFETERLSRQESVDVLAYILRRKEFPVGDAELPADFAALRMIRLAPDPDE